MAKKARTPTPPRKVQAPKRRDHPRPSRPPQAGGEDRTRIYLGLFALLGVIGVLVAVIVVMTGNTTSGGPPGKAGVRVPNLAKLPGR